MYIVHIKITPYIIKKYTTTLGHSSQYRQNITVTHVTAYTSQFTVQTEHHTHVTAYTSQFTVQTEHHTHVTAYTSQFTVQTEHHTHVTAYTSQFTVQTEHHTHVTAYTSQFTVQTEHHTTSQPDQQCLHLQPPNYGAMCPFGSVLLLLGCWGVIISINVLYMSPARYRPWG